MPKNISLDTLNARASNVINEAQKQLKALKTNQLKPTVWIAPTLLNSWVYSGSGTLAGYYIDGANIVHLKGLIRSGTVPATIFVLPVGFRPAEQFVFTVVANNAFGRVDVDSAGNVIAQAGSNAFLSLDGISFRAA